MGKSDKEKEMLYEWGINHYSDSIFSQSDHRKDSYFQQRTESSYCREYTFETLPELMEKLNILWKNDEAMENIKKVIAASAMKNKPMADAGNGQGKSQDGLEEKLPIYIYNF